MSNNESYSQGAWNTVVTLLSRSAMVSMLATFIASSCWAQSGILPRGDFSVGPAGAATYSLPIQLPPGISGIAPTLAITYNSQSGNGLLGVGGSMSGLSAIGRCPQMNYQDAHSIGVTYNATGNADRYCIDGNRLMVVSGQDGANGAEYRVEQEGFSKLTSIVESGTTGGPTYFTAQTRSGLTMEYGKTVDARDPVPGTTAVKNWMLNKATDAAGNSYMVSYGKTDAGDIYPTQIKYADTGGNAFAHVFFEYESRPDVILSYHAGKSQKLTLRLKRVTTSSGAGNTQLANAKGFSYTVSYKLSNGGSSLITNIEVCHVGGAVASSCMPKILFESASGASTQAELTPYNSAAMAGSYNASQYWVNGPDINVITGDFNADGKTDFIAQCKVANCWGSIPTFLAAGQGNWNVSTPAPTLGGTNAALLWVNNPNLRLITGDFNGDGATDFIVQNYASNNGWTSSPTFFSQKDGTWGVQNPTITYNSINISQHWINSPCVNVIPGDFNGDGRTDLLLQNFCANSGWGTTPILLSKGDGSWEVTNNVIMLGSTNASQTWVNTPTTHIVIGDFDGDGRSDIFLRSFGSNNGWGSNPVFLARETGWQSINAVLMSGSINASVNWINSSSVQVLTGDFNGDGKTDIFLRNTGLSSGWTTTPTFLSMGDGGWLGTNPTLTYGSTNASQYWINNPDTAIFTGDFDGNGTADFFVQCKLTNCGWGSIPTFLSNANGTFTSYNPAPMVGNTTAAQVWVHYPNLNPVLGDFDGDGKTDFFMQNVAANHGWTTTPMLLSNSERGESITRIGNSVAGYVGPIGYQALAKVLGDSYIKDKSVNYPLINLTPPLRMVTSVIRSDAVGGNLSTLYKYGNLIFENGKGLRGFEWTQTEDVNTGLKSRMTYRQDFPFTGMVSKSTQGVGGSVDNLSQTTYEYGCYDFDQTLDCQVATGKRYFTYMSAMVESAKDLKGTALPGKRTETVYDCSSAPVKCFGNATKVTITTLDAAGNATGYVKETVSDFYNDETNWRLGKLLRSKVTSTAP